MSGYDIGKKLAKNTDNCKAKHCGEFSIEQDNILRDKHNKNIKKCSTEKKIGKCLDEEYKKSELKTFGDERKKCYNLHCREETLESIIYDTKQRIIWVKNESNKNKLVLNYLKKGLTDKDSIDKLYEKHRKLFKTKKEIKYNFELTIEESQQFINSDSKEIKTHEKELKKLEKELKHIQQKKGQKHTSKSKRNKKGGYRTKKRSVK